MTLPLHNQLAKLKNRIITDSQKLKKESIQDLAGLYELAILDKRMDIIKEMQTLLGKDEILISDICIIIKNWKNSKKLNISSGWIEEILDKKYKHETKPKKEPVNQFSTYDEQTYDKAQTLAQNLLEADQEALYDILKEPVQNIKKRRTEGVREELKKREIDLFGDAECKLAQFYSLLKDLFADLEKRAKADHLDHHDRKHEEEYIPILEKEIDEVKSACDTRNIASEMRTHALVLAAEFGSSQKNVMDGEWDVRNHWDVEEDEENCRKNPRTECNDKRQCKDRRCNCKCHEYLKPATSKGFKYKINSSENLTDFKNTMKRLKTIQDEKIGEVLCPIGKEIASNPYHKKAESFNAMTTHILDVDCEYCKRFLENNEDFFKEEK